METTFPGFEHLHIIRPEADDRASMALIENATVDEAEAVFQQAEGARPVIRARWLRGGRRPGDVVMNSHLVSSIVSGRCIDVLRESGISGWGSVPCVLLDKAGNPVPGYFFLTIQGRCGPFDYSRSECRPVTYSAGRYLRVTGLYFDPECWDGSDVFMPSQRNGCILVTEKVRQALLGAKIKGFVSTPLAHFEWSEFPREDGRLH